MEKINKINKSKKPPSSRPSCHLSGSVHRFKEKEKQREKKDKRREKGLAGVRKKVKDRKSVV